MLFPMHWSQDCRFEIEENSALIECFTLQSNTFPLIHRDDISLSKSWECGRQFIFECCFQCIGPRTADLRLKRILSSSNVSPCSLILFRFFTAMTSPYISPGTVENNLFLNVVSNALVPGLPI